MEPSDVRRITTSTNRAEQFPETESFPVPGSKTTLLLAARAALPHASKAREITPTKLTKKYLLFMVVNRGC
jgi:hypothetical protein